MTEFEISSGLQAQVDEMISSCEDFHEVDNEGVRVSACFRIKHNKDDELVASGAPSDLKKISPMMQAFVSHDYVVVIDQYVWNHSSTTMQQALLHSALMRLHIAPNDAGTEIKVKTRKPDVIEFSQTLRRYGLYKEEAINLRDILASAAQTAVSNLQPRDTGDDAPRPRATSRRREVLAEEEV